MKKCLCLTVLAVMLGSILSSCRGDRTPAAPAGPVAKPKGVITKSYSVRGVRYRPINDMRQALQYTEEGEASFYNQDGTRSASGEILKAGTLYAAHRTLPMPCTVRVTNLRNGKSCEARVIDRGPFHRRRIIDLSHAVGRSIGMNPYSVGRVKVEVISIGTGKDKISNN